MIEPDWTKDALAAGGMGNTVLYKMVQDFPDHSCPDIVGDKMLIIGRVYSAAVTRGAGLKGGDVEDNEGGLYRHLAEQIVAKGSELDKQIENCRNYGRVTLANVHSVIEAHTFLNGLIVEGIKALRGQDSTSERKVWARSSFVSKYLHFHVPMAFFILDSIVSATLKNLRRPHARTQWPTTCYKEHRTAYGTHCVRMLDCAHRYYSGADWTPRMLDGHLMGYIKGDGIPTDVQVARDKRIEADRSHRPAPKMDHE